MTTIAGSPPRWTRRWWCRTMAPPLGTPMGPALLARLCTQVDGVEYIKEEVAPEPRSITAAITAAGGQCRGVFGGQGAICMIDEHRRGAVGNMPGSQVTDVLVDAWDLLEGGEEGRARQLYDRLLPLMAYERLYGVAVYKEVLHRRGIIGCVYRRAPGDDLDEHDRLEVTAALKRLEPALRL